MADNIQRSKGLAAGYKFDRGGMPAEFGPYVGVVKNNVDPIRAGRVQVYIQQLAGDNPDDQSLWRTVSYIPAFYGLTQHTGTDTGTGSWKGNNESYGMWFTPPDLGTEVICFFVAGDPNQGFWIGCVPSAGINHMVPAIGSAKKYEVSNPKQAPYLEGVKQAPVTEINSKNLAILENPRFFDQAKPVHSYVAGVMIQQGLIRDPLRGPITSSSQRESPSAVYGVNTPGRPVWAGGMRDAEVKKKVESGELKLQDIKVEARRGGHSIVMDDGDLQGYDNLVRIRTSKGHQITMSDDGDFFYIIHANGQSWIELGTEGTLDVYTTNSVNIRSQGQINLHADDSINMYAGKSINMKSETVKIEAVDLLEMISKNTLNAYSNNKLSIMSDGTLALKNKTNGGWDGGNSLAFKAGKIDLNGPAPPKADKAVPLKDLELPDTEFVPNKGWQEAEEKIKTIVTRAPTHEPYPYHNRGVDVQVNLSTAAAAEQTTSSLPPDFSIRRTG